MRKKIFSSVFALALLASAGWGVNKSMSNDANLNDLALSNVEALADGEAARDDCEPANNEECVEFFSSPNGNGYSVLFDHKKKVGWT